MQQSFLQFSEALCIKSIETDEKIHQYKRVKEKAFSGSVLDKHLISCRNKLIVAH